MRRLVIYSIPWILTVGAAAAAATVAVLCQVATRQACKLAAGQAVVNVIGQLHGTKDATVGGSRCHCYEEQQGNSQQLQEQSKKDKQSSHADIGCTMMKVLCYCKDITVGHTYANDNAAAPLGNFVSPSESFHLTGPF